MPAEMSEGGMGTGHEDTELRSWLAAVADELIPGDGAMPSARDVGVAETRLEVVLVARPDLLPPLREAHRRGADTRPGEVLDLLRSEDPAAHDALLMIVAGAYYSSPVVNRLLAYTGQTPEPVRADTYPPYVEENLLDGVLTRGPVDRPTPPAHGHTTFAATTQRQEREDA
jgi:hypothetical protein